MSDKPRTTAIQRQALLGHACLEPDGLVEVIEMTPEVEAALREKGLIEDVSTDTD